MIVLFDGLCNLCEASVQFIIRHDPQKKFRFAALQSEYGQYFLREHDFAKRDFDSLILVDESGRIFTCSAAWLRIMPHLNALWPLMTVFFLIPSFMRDALYRFIARRRYFWFGKKEICWLPTPELRDRFLD